MRSKLIPWLENGKVNILRFVTVLVKEAATIIAELFFADTFYRAAVKPRAFCEQESIAQIHIEQHPIS